MSLIKPILITKKLLREVTNEAKNSTRLRKNYNFHSDESDICQRLLNAIEPGTYIQPHRHEDKDETIILLSGCFGLILFKDDGNISEYFIVSKDSENLGITIPKGVYHTLVSLQTNTIFFESKAGPYRPLNEHEKSPWTPAENETNTKDYHRNLEKLFQLIN